MRILALLCCLGATEASADWPCDDWWFTRNLVLDRLGHCFSSALGRATFDNGGCIGANPTPSDADAALIERLRRNEADWECSVDNATPRPLDVDRIEQRRQMYHLPVAGGYESGCIGYRGDAILLRAGRSPSAPITGYIPTGGNIVFAFESEGGWDFFSGGPGDGMGWAMTPDLNPETNPGICDMYAG